MGRLLRLLLLLAALGALGVAAYAAFVEIPAPRRDMIKKVPHDQLFPQG